VTAPIAAEVVMFPDPAAKVRFCAPFTELLRVIFPAPVPLLSVVAAARVMGPAKLMAAFVVRTLPPIVTGPAPLWLNAPLDWRFPTAVDVNVPVFATVMPPVPPAVHAAPRTIEVPVKLIPPEPLVMSAPLKVEVPLPAV